MELVSSSDGALRRQTLALETQAQYIRIAKVDLLITVFDLILLKGAMISYMTVEDLDEARRHVMRAYFPNCECTLGDSWDLGLCPLEITSQRSLLTCTQKRLIMPRQRRTFSRKAYESMSLSDYMLTISQERAVAKETCRNMDLATYISLLHSYPAGCTPR